MIVNKRKLYIAMARACMNTADVQKKAGMPRPTLDNAIGGKNVRTATVGKIARITVMDTDR